MSKTKAVDIGSKMSFTNRGRSSYSMEQLKAPAMQSDQIVKIDLAQLENAPDAWNFYPPLDEEAFEKLVLSIMEHGLLHPIVVRKIGDRHIILSGHNRVRAYQVIRTQLTRLSEQEQNRTLAESGLKASDFDQIMAVIKEDLTDEAAREIIIDANYVQRQLNPQMMMRSVIEKYKLVQSRRKDHADPSFKQQKTRELVAEEFQLSGRHIDRYRKLEQLVQPLQEQFFEGKLSLALAAKLAGLSESVQLHIANAHLETLLSCGKAISMELAPQMRAEEIDALMGRVLAQRDHIELWVQQDGKRRRVRVDDPQKIAQILAVLK